MAEAPWQIPRGWVWARFAELLDEGPTNGYSPAGGPNATGTPSFKLSATTQGRFIINEDTIKPLHETVPPEAKCWLAPGDVLVQRANSLHYLGRTAIYEGPPSTYVYPDLMMRVRIGEPVTRTLAWRYLNSIDGSRYFRTRATGTAGNMPKINGEVLREMQFPLPPFNEQRRIVAKLETLTARSRAARDALEQVSALLERFRQSVLAEAFRGDLTADWRKQNPDVEPASVLLERIRASRGLQPHPRGETGVPEWVPDGWCWSSVGEVADVDGGLTRHAEKRSAATRQVPLVSVAAVRFRRIDIAEIGLIGLLPSDGDKARLERGDLLVVEGNGSRDQIGRVAIWDADTPDARHQNHLIRVRARGGIDSRFLLEWLASPGGRERLERAATSVSGLYNLSLSKVAGIDIPLPTLTEQAEIVRIVASLLRWVDAIERSVRDQVEALGRFDQAILAKAFRGELVPQDPNDEPASVLLDRIRAERAHETSTRKPSRRRRADEPAPLQAAGSPEADPPPPPAPPPAPPARPTPSAKKANGARPGDALLASVLAALKRDALHRIADARDVALADRRSLDAARAGILQAGLGFDAVLEPLKREELQAVCRALDLDDRGRSKDELRARIVGAQQAVRS
ncbi:MAG: restriction endonuclease subunit S [Planctomycetes bacterium]|nr:restriction endonuclease subunit S [Planctomycetota bacterium]